MSACIQFFGKFTGKCVPLQEIDAAMCAHFGVIVDKDKYYCNWSTTIALALSVRGSYKGAREVFYDSPQALKIIDFLEHRYTINNWSE